jgi:hypothetical protein
MDETPMRREKRHSRVEQWRAGCENLLGCFLRGSGFVAPGAPRQMFKLMARR